MHDTKDRINPGQGDGAGRLFKHWEGLRESDTYNRYLTILLDVFESLIACFRTKQSVQECLDLPLPVHDTVSDLCWGWVRARGG